jgi:hypothetical protein
MRWMGSKQAEKVASWVCAMTSSRSDANRANPCTWSWRAPGKFSLGELLRRWSKGKVK